MQFYIDEDLHEQLRELARKQGRSLSALAREALHRVYGGDEGRRRETLEAIAGLWRDREEIGNVSEHVRRLRKDARRTRES
jgi:predicted transcriptional regulator